jgi:hypothetical protein
MVGVRVDGLLISSEEINLQNVLSPIYCFDIQKVMRMRAFTVPFLFLSDIDRH